MARWLRHNNDYRIANPNNRVKQCNGQNITQPNSSGYGVMSTNVDGGSAIGMRSTSNLTNVTLPRDYSDDNSSQLGGDVGPVVFVGLGGGSNGDITSSVLAGFSGYAAFNRDGLSLEVGDCVKFDTTSPYSGFYRVLALDGVECAFNAPYVATSGQIGTVYKQSGTIDTQSAAYTAVGRKGNKMERDRVHKQQKMVMGNEPSLVRSGYYAFNSGVYTRPVTYTDRYPSFKVSGTGSQDAVVVNHGLSVGGGYSMRMGQGLRNMKRGTHKGINEQ